MNIVYLEHSDNQHSINQEADTVDGHTQAQGDSVVWDEKDEFVNSVNFYF